MKITNLQEIDEFKKAIDACEGDVWLESIYGDRYNLKSALTQYVAIADLMRDKNGDLELFAKLPQDEMRLMKFFE